MAYIQSRKRKATVIENDTLQMTNDMPMNGLRSRNSAGQAATLVAMKIFCGTERGKK